MTFNLARKKLADLADGRYHCIRFELTTFKGGRIEPRCDMYIDGPGWTKHDNATWESALAEMLAIVHGPESASDEELDEMSYGIDTATADKKHKEESEARWEASDMIRREG